MVFHILGYFRNSKDNKSLALISNYDVDDDDDDDDDNDADYNDDDDNNDPHRQIVDFMTLPPLFLSIWLERSWIGLRFFR